MSDKFLQIKLLKLRPWILILNYLLQELIFDSFEVS